jgi:orotate phosphoribosyltransferase-like protein
MKENILKLRSMGYTYNQIQKELGCSKGTISYHLGEGQKEKNKQRSQKRREEIRDIIRTFKQEKPCMDCKIVYPYYVLDFDHIGNDKVEGISKMASWFPLDEIIAEIKKCEVVCANCHRERTHLRRMLS